nr:retrovirus-related Pol polyprotein from transposon TNT 1-94 [Tanacetum cinerariifolium]
MVRGNGENQFRQYDGKNTRNQIRYNAGQNARNQNRCNAVQNAGNHVGQNVVQNPDIQNVRNQNVLIVVIGIDNQNETGNIEEARIQLQAKEFDLMDVAADCEEVEEVNVNCILMANFQQASSSGTHADKAPIYDSDRSAEEIWLRVQQMMKGSDIGIQEKKAKLFNEWERFTSNERESTESYYHPFLKSMNDLKRSKHFPEKIARNGNQNQVGNGNLVAARAEGNIVGQNGNQIRCYNCRGVGHYARNCTVRPKRRDVAYLQTQLLIAQKEEAGIQLQAGEYDLMAAAADLDEIEEVNANCILMVNLQQALTSGTQTDSAPVYDTDGSAEVHKHCDDNEIFNMFTQEEQYTELLEPIPESHQVPQNDNDVISEDTSVEQGGETVEQHPANFEQTRALYESLYQNLAIEVEKVNSFNRKLKETNADLTTELARFKNQERCFEISQEKYDKLKRCYQQSISELNKQLSKEKSIVSFLLEEKKRLKSDFKTCEDKLLDKQIQLEKRIKELNNIVLKTGQSIQTIHMLSPKPDSFYHIEHKMALGYQNPFYLKQDQKKQQSLYDEKVLLDKHDPPIVHDLEETQQLAQKSREKMKQMNKEIKLANYPKINHLSGDFVPQTALSRKELYFSNNSKTTNVSKSISIPNEDFSNDTTPSVARKFLNEVKSTIVTLQRVVKQRMTIETHNWSSSAHQELHKIVRDENFPIVNQVDARLQNFEIQFLKEAAKFVGDFKSLANEADASLAKHKALEVEIERLLKAVKLENENVELEFQVLNYARANAYLKTTYKNLFDSISTSRAQTQTIIASLQNELQSTIYKNAKLRTQLFKKTNALSKPVTSNSVSTPQESNGMNNDKVIAPGMFRINPSKTSREEKHVPNRVSASTRTKSIIVSQPPVITEKNVNFDLNDLSSTGVDNTKTRRPQPRSNTKHDRVPSASKSSQSKNKEAKDVISKVVCVMCSKCLISVNHDKCLRNYVNDKNSRGKKQTEKVYVKEIQKKYQPKVTKPKKVEHHKSLATPKPRKSRLLLRWLPTGKLFDKEGKLVDSSESKSQFDCSNGNLKLLINFVWKFMGTVRFENDHVAAILGVGDLQWGNFLITRVQFVEGLGVDLLKGDRSTNLYTINLHEMASASPICLMACASSTKSWLWHQRLSHLNFDTINDLARNDLVASLSKFKYHKEHLFPLCEEGKSKRASHPPKPVPNSRQILHLLHMDLCGPMRISSINGKWYVLVIVDDYSRYTWVHFLKSKDEAPGVIITFLKRITVLLQSPVIIIRTDNGTEFKNQVLKEYFDTVGISHQMSSVRTPQQNGVVERRNRTLLKAARTMLIFSRAPLFLGAEVIATTTLCYPKNDHEDIGKLGAKGDIGFFIGYSADSCAYRIFNRWTKKIMESMNVSFDELSTMAFEQRSSKPGLQSMTSRHISSGLDLTYAPSTISMQQLSEGDLDLLFEAMYDDYIGVQPAAESSSSQNVDSSNMHTFYQPYPHEFQWIKDHPLEQVIGEPSRHVLTRNQLRSDGDMCMYALTVSTMKPKNVKETMTDPAWIESMQEELLQFKRLDVWVLC